MTANPIPQTAVDALYDELFRVGRYLHAPVPIDPKEIIRRHLTAAQQQAHPAPPSAPAGVEDMQRRLDREESDHARTIDQRDAAEDALGRMFQAVTGRTAE